MDHYADDLAALTAHLDLSNAIHVGHSTGGEIIRVMIHVVAIGRLARASMPAPVMRDDAIAMVQEKHHLRVPIVRSEWPAVRKHDRLSLTPVLVENLVCRLLLEKKKTTQPLLD